MWKGGIVPLHWQWRLPFGHRGLLMSLNQQVKKEVVIPSELVDLDCLRETGVLLHGGGKENYGNKAFIGYLFTPLTNYLE